MRRVYPADVRVLFEPLDLTRSRPSTDPESSPFSAKWTETLALLRREAAAVGAPEVVLCVDAAAGNMKRDGGIRADAVVRSHHVEVYLPATNAGPLRFECSKYRAGYRRDSSGWQANVRAIALGLEALRKIDRYGIGTGTEQYRGFGALPPGDPIALGSAMTVEEAARLLVDLGEVHGCDEPGDPSDLWEPTDVQAEIVNGYYKRAAFRHHPDVGGDPDTFRRITEARELLLATGR